MSTDDDNIEIIGAPQDQGDGVAGDDTSITDLVQQPAKVMRIGTMIKQLLEEVKAAPLDDASRNRLREIHKASIHELEDGLAPELRDELERLRRENKRLVMEREILKKAAAFFAKQNA